MAQPFIIITATDPADPVVGSSNVARKSMAEAHAMLLDACDTHNLRPFVFVTNEDPDLASVYDQGLVTKITNTYESAFPLFNMLMSALGENGLAETKAVFFDDAMSFDVEVFVECWRRVYPMVRLPPFFGMVHATDRGGYAQTTVLNWHKESASKLSLFREIFAMSDQAANTLRAVGVSNIRVIAPFFGLGEQPRNRLVPQEGMALNWIYSFSHVDHYDQYILLANQLNTIIQDVIATPDIKRDEDLPLPARVSPNIYSREMPDGVAKPRGFDKGAFAAAEWALFDLLDNKTAWPKADSITISFKPDSEIDYRLLKLAEAGYMVMAPDRGIYQEALDPVCTYPAEWLDNYNNEVPEKVTMHIAQEFMERMIRLKLTWLERHGKKNVVSGDSAAFLRRVVRRNIEAGPENVADRIFTHLGLAY